ncbi:MAG: MBG domain-containing protein [Acidobacteriota bacterium]
MNKWSCLPGSRRWQFASLTFAILTLALVVGPGVGWLSAQAPQTGIVAGRNVNMVSGTGWPDGDPFLQRQNEPSVAASSRNPLHLLGGSNDYRTVDLPGLPNGGETGDAWLGVFKSFDGGQRWRSTLIPGYPQDQSPIGIASPLHGYQAAADPVVRAGTNGLFYYSGIVFDRGANARSRVFVSRFIDNNNKENGDPIAYLGTSAVASHSGRGGAFIDKPWLVVDVPRPGSKSCVITTPGPGTTTLTQTIQAGMVYLTYSLITGSGVNIQSAIMFSASSDCGATWTKPIQISDPAAHVNQGSAMAIDPSSGGLYITWRQFGIGGQTDAVVVAHATSGGRSFSALRKIRELAANHTAHEVEGWLKRERDEDERDEREKKTGHEKVVAEHGPGGVNGQGGASLVTASGFTGTFDQPTASDQFRTNAYPTIAIDGQGRAYLAWTERGLAGFNVDQSRIVISTSLDGLTWTAPKVVEDPVAPTTGSLPLPGHQLMPSLSFAGGKLVLAFYDLREDISGTFATWVDDGTASVNSGKRHTIDIRAAMADPGDMPAFEPSVRVSQYMQTVRPLSGVTQQLQYNPPNLPMFKLGTAPFMGDYIDITPSPVFVRNAAGQWSFNVAPVSAPVFHLVWTDNRDVRPPHAVNALGKPDWTKYTPPANPFSLVACDPNFTASRNQNIYTARLTRGLLAGSPGNSKQLSAKVPRGFVVFAQNTTAALKSFRLSIANQPVGGRASFTQFEIDGLLTSVDVNVAPRSSVSRTVYVTSTDPRAMVTVNVNEITAPGVAGTVIAGGLTGAVVLNPDISNPDISNPDISNPDISNPDISNAEVYNPDISNPDISNPDISNPDISNPDISNPDISNAVILNPDISNPDISNPDISNPDISNPDISNPDISNPDISNGAIADVTWTMTNEGNTTSTFNVGLFMQNATLPAGIKTQLLLHKQYKTPTSDGCTLKVQTQSVLVANIVDPVFKAATDPVTRPDPGSPDISNATMWLEPGASARITLRVVNTNPAVVSFNPAAQVTPAVTSVAYNVDNLKTATVPPTTPPSTTPPPNTKPSTSNVPVLTFATQPATSTIGVVLAPFTVQAGNLPTGKEIPVTIAISAGGLLGGTMTKMTVGGVATFSDIVIDRAIASLALVASSSSANAIPTYSNTFSIAKLTATITITPASLAATYDGTQKAVSVSTSPANLATVITYGLSEVLTSTIPPTAAGQYGVIVNIAPNNPTYQGTATGTLNISPATASVVLGNTSQLYDGTPKSVTVTTTPTSLAAGVSVTYGGLPTAPIAAGPYAVVATVNDPNYVGSASGTLTITPASAVLTVGGLAGQVYDGMPKTVTVTTAPPGVAFSVAYTGNSAVPVYAGNYPFVVTVTDPNWAGTPPQNGILAIAKATPVITWPAPAAISLGTPLGAVQLNATANVPGTFAYTPVSGTVLSAGVGQTLSVAFAPTDATNYAPASKNVTIDVTSSSFAVTVPGTAGGTVNYNVGGGPAAAQGTAPVDAGLVMSPGSTVVVTATGSVSWYTTDVVVGPAGLDLGGHGDFLMASPPTPAICLIARVGNGPWQYVGVGPTTITASTTGTLQFAVNDSYYGDNAGSFVAHVALGPSGIVGLWSAQGNGLNSASGATATVQGGGTYATGAVGQAFSLVNADSTANQFVDVGVVPSLQMTNALSFAAWIYPTGPGNGTFATMGDGVVEGGILINQEYQYEVARYADGSIRFAFNNTSPGWAWINSGAMTPVNTWSHVAVTYDSGAVKTYLNGVLVNTVPASGPLAGTPSYFEIGGRHQTADQPGFRQNFSGSIDEVAMFNRALTAAEVARLFSGQ